MGNGKVLIIDDDPTMVEVLSGMLSEEGYKIDSVNTGAEGIECFREQQHEVVLTDLKIGDMTGIEVLRSLKEINQQSAVIILTGYASTESAVEAVKLGANDYLLKPVKMPDLIKSVKTHMSSVHLVNRVNELNIAVADERDKLRRSVAELSLLQRLAERMMTVLSFFEGFEVILNLLVEEVEADVAVIYDYERGTARMSASVQPGPKELQQLADIITEHGRKMLGAEITCHVEDFVGLGENETDTADGELLSTIIVPLIQEERPFGLLVAASRKDENFETEWSEFIAEISQEASEFLSRIKQSIEKQKYFTSAIVEHTLDGIAVIDPVSKEVLLNPVARSMLDLAPGPAPNPEEVGALLDFNIDDIRKELTLHGEGDVQPRTMILQSEITLRGQPAYYRLNISVLPDVESREGKLLVVIHDVTQERQIEEMKNRLISNITHEVRTPTGVIKEFTALILDGVAGELTDTQRQYIKIMHSNIERLSRLIENLLTLARADKGGFTVVLQPIELKPIIDTVTASMELKLQRKKIKSVIDIPDELPLIYGDKDAVTQILTNLIDNAFKYSPEDTRVKISVKVKGVRVEIAVADQGYGIAPADQEAIFSRFHRLVDQNDPRFQEGVGLGLALVKDLVMRHGGDLWVKSEVASGSTFYFSLQIAREDEEHRPA